METVHYYNVDLNWESERRGRVSSPELTSSIEVVTPPEFPKGIAGIWSPEHFLVAAASSCLMTTFLAIAENSGLLFSQFTCGAKGKLEKVEGKFMISEIELMPKVTVLNESDKEKAMKVITKAEANCLISNSIKSRILFTPEIIVADACSIPAH